MATLNEDNAGSYAVGLVREVLARNIKTDAEGKGFGGTFNTNRLNVDKIFNYTDSEKFANDVVAAISAKYGKKYRNWENIIKDIARDYAEKKMKISKPGAASTVTESYFDY